MVVCWGSIPTGTVQQGAQQHSLFKVTVFNHDYSFSFQAPKLLRNVSIDTHGVCDTSFPSLHKHV